MSSHESPLPAEDYRCGFVAILGKPNAGKSTLLNALLGEKLAAVSGLPQTTRDRIHGIVSRDGVQAIFVDLPGLISATDKLNEALRQRVVESLNDVDCILHLVDPTDADPVDADMREIVARAQGPMLFVVSKADTRSAGFDARSWAGEIADPARYSAFLKVASPHGAGLEELMAAVRTHLPQGPPLYDPDDLTDRDLRFLCGELIREKVFHFTHQEIPYSTAVTIDDFQERESGKWFIAASIHVERDSQKGMVIGKGGAMLKRISQAARHDIEALAGAPVFLQLFVRVTHKWRKNEARLREFGYSSGKKKNH